MRQPGLAGLAAAAMAVSLLTARAEAGSKGRRNTAIGLGAATAYSVARGKMTHGLVLGAGTAYAYKRYRDSRKAERRRARLARAGYYGSPSRTHRYYRSPRYRTAGYRSTYSNGAPPGWSHGRKRGWRGRSVPPGHWRYYRR